jgi:hypothetical protein
MLFFTGAVLFFSFGLYRARHFFYWSWLCFALALSTRYNAVLFAPIVIAVLALALLLWDTEVQNKLWSKDFFVGPLLALGLLIPWLLRQQLTSGNLLSGFKAARRQVQTFERGLAPWYFYPAHIPEMISWIPVVLLLCGIFWAVRKRERFALHCLLAAATIIVWFSCYGYKATRMVTSILPFLAILAAVGLTKQLVPERFGRSFYYGGLAVCLSAVFVINFLQVRKTLAHSVASGYPSFLTAMRFVREQTSPDAILIGANHTQIFWYTNRRVRRFPKEEQLKTALEQSEWVVVTNFEREQPPYIARLLKLFTHKDIRAGSVFTFQDKRFWTVLVRSDLLRQRLEEKGDGNRLQEGAKPQGEFP